MKTAGSKTVAKHKSEPAHKKLKEVVMSPMENGMMMEHRFQEPPMGPNGHYMSPPDPEKHAVMSRADLSKHMDMVADHMGMEKSSPAPEPAPKAGDGKKKGAMVKGVGKPAAAAEKETEPDDDDED